MTTTTAPPLSRSTSTSSSTSSSTSTATATAIAAVVLVAFGGYSLWVIAGWGLTGFLALAAREPWGMQLLLDLAIACWFGGTWMVRDARRRGIAAWPFVVVTVLAGSIGLLGYAVLRGLLTPRRGT